MNRRLNIVMVTVLLILGLSGCVGGNTYQTELPIRVTSSIEEETCFLLGQDFSITMTIDAPPDWNDINRTSSQEIKFRLQVMGPDTDSVVFLNLTQQRVFVLKPGEMAMTDIEITVSLENGDRVTYALNDFPFFKYTRRDGISHFCVQLPGEEDLKDKKSLPMLQA